MKYKTVIDAKLNCDKCRSQGMKIAAMHGATQVAVEGEKLVVVGSEIDPVKLTCSLRKKLPHGTANIISHQEEKENKEQKKDQKGKKTEKDETEKSLPPQQPSIYYVPFPAPDLYYMQEVSDQQAPFSFCSIL